MAAIYLIRHGQASFGSADYDQLSEKGRQQAVLLGQYWRSRATPSKLFCGDLLRHNQTLSGFNEGYQGVATPTVIHSGFNEFDHVDILNNYHAQGSENKKSKDILVFTSGGTISVIVQHILKLSDQQALEINQQARNTSVTKLLFSENMLSVDYLNNYSHLEQVGEDWVTFR